jgi:hypothetical protein
VVEQIEEEKWKGMDVCKRFKAMHAVFYNVNNLLLLWLIILDNNYKGGSSIDAMFEWHGKYKKKAANASLHEMDPDKWNNLVLL